MARTTTLSELRTRARRLGDNRTSSRYSDSELNDEINLALTYVYDMLVTAYGERYYEKATPSSFSTVAGTATYNLPSDFYKLSRICVLVDGTRERNLERFVDMETDFTQPVQSVFSVRLYYVPCATKLVADGDTFDGVNGWEKMIAALAAIALKIPDEEDLSGLMAMVELETRRIQNAKSARDKGQPHRIADRAGSLRRPWWDYVMTNDAQLPRYSLKNGVVELREGNWP
jgi:hypothetical protein